VRGLANESRNSRYTRERSTAGKRGERKPANSHSTGNRGTPPIQAVKNLESPWTKKAVPKNFAAPDFQHERGEGKKEGEGKTRHGAKNLKEKVKTRSNGMRSRGKTWYRTGKDRWAPGK